MCVESNTPDVQVAESLLFIFGSFESNWLSLSCCSKLMRTSRFDVGAWLLKCSGVGTVATPPLLPADLYWYNHSLYNVHAPVHSASLKQSAFYLL